MNKLSLAICGLLSLCLLAATAPSLAAAAETTAAVAKSPNDERDYRALTLDNGLKVMLISDPEADKAAAALDVFSGSNSDPETWPGLTHFLEHMLFLGTEKFPAAGEYQEYIASHGGGHNAYTAYENTNYYFDIEKDYLAPALDRFSQFFIAPLFTPEYVDRERNAVHSEYQSNLQNDGRRSYSIFKRVMNQEHPLSRFSVGSLDTLTDRDGTTLREALLRHYRENYSADIMSLAILGTETLDQLEALAREFFSAIPNRDVSRPATAEPLFEAGTLPALLSIKPVRDSRSLAFTFPIPVAHPHYRSKPLNYLGNVLGHEGEGSLLSLLRERGWANGLSAGGGMSYQDNATFSISIGLTEAGVDRVDDIAALVFQFIELARREGIHDWLFQEQRGMADIAFLFQEPSQPIGTVSSLAQRRQEYPASEVLTAPYTYESFDPALLRDYLSYLRPDNLLLTLTHQSVETDATDAVFGGEYSVAPLPDARLAAWTDGPVDPALAIAEPNPFMPENLAIKPYEGEPGPGGPQDKPELIMDEEGVRLWFKQDNEYQVPRANFYLYAMTPLFNDSLENTLLSSLVVNLVNDKLNEYSYPANLAGVFYGVSRRSRGFTLRLGGYDDRQQALLEEVLATLSQGDFDQDRFDIIKTEMVRNWQNAEKQTPYVRLFQQVQALLVNPYWSEEERIAAIRGITLEQVEAFVPRMLSGLTIDALYHGNVLPADARRMMAVVLEHLDVDPAVQRPPFGTVVKMEEGNKVVQQMAIEHEDSAIVIYMQGPDDSLRTRAIVNLLATILRTPFYDTLRTERQLGYVVNASTLPILKTNGLVMYIESPNTHPIALEANINDFLAAYESELAAMSAERFADIKAGLLNNLRQDPQRLSSLSSRFWSDILIEEYGEDSTLAMAEAVQALEQQDIVDYYRAHVAAPAASRLVSWSVGNPHQDVFAAAEPARAADLLLQGKAYEEFKAGKEVFTFESGTRAGESGP